MRVLSPISDAVVVGNGSEARQRVSTGAFLLALTTILVLGCGLQPDECVANAIPLSLFYPTEASRMTAVRVSVEIRVVGEQTGACNLLLGSTAAARNDVLPWEVVWDFTVGPEATAAGPFSIHDCGTGTVLYASVDDDSATLPSDPPVGMFLEGCVVVERDSTGGPRVPVTMDLSPVVSRAH
jgi:hypothetical protein